MKIELYGTLTLFLLLNLHHRAMAQKPGVCKINWKVAAELPALNGQSKALGLAGPVAGVHHQVLLVGGGANFPEKMPWQGGIKKYYDAVYVFKKEGKEDQIKLYPKVFHLPYPVAYGASCSTAAGIIYAGGENENGISNKVLCLQWDAAAKKITVKNLPDLPLAVTNAAITASNNIIYLGGGEMANGVSSGFYSFDLKQPAAGWQQLPSLPNPVSHAVLVAQSHANQKYIYLIGGRKKNSGGISDLYASVYRYDLKNNTWQPMPALPYALSAGTGMATASGEIILFGGDTGETFHKTEQLIAAIQAEKNETTKQQLTEQKAKVQATHPGFNKQVLQYNAVANTWEITGTIPFAAPVTTTAFSWGKDIIIPTGEIKAGIRTPQLLRGKILCK